MTEACVGWIFQIGVTETGACAARDESSRWTWYLNATDGRESWEMFTKYSPDLDGAWEMKEGFGATFSSTGKFSSRMFSDPDEDVVPLGLCCKASSPMTTALTTSVFSKVALTVSTIDALSPG